MLCGVCWVVRALCASAVRAVWFVFALALIGAGRGLDMPLACPGGRACRAIRTAWLSALPCLHLRPIDVMVSHGPWGDLV